MAERHGWAVWAIAALAVAAIGGGLTVTGGPMQGRVEKRDQLRAGDLSALSRQAACLARAGSLRDGDLSPTGPCPGTPRMADPFTGAPYVIELLDDRHMRLCAGFEQEPRALARQRAHAGDEWQGNCMVAELPRPGQD